jgi:hypothetical protein
MPMRFALDANRFRKELKKISGQRVDSDTLFYKFSITKINYEDCTITIDGNLDLDSFLRLKLFVGSDHITEEVYNIFYKTCLYGTSQNQPSIVVINKKTGNPTILNTLYAVLNHLKEK